MLFNEFVNAFNKIFNDSPKQFNHILLKHIGRGTKKYKNLSRCSHCGFVDIMGLWEVQNLIMFLFCVFVCVYSSMIVTLTKLLSFT